jgi:hypothetical protein
LFCLLASLFVIVIKKQRFEVKENESYLAK